MAGVYPICEGQITAVAVGGNAPFTCSGTWVFKPEPIDSTSIYAQLVALNEFNPAQIAGIVTFCLSMFIVGFGVGMVINKLRRS